MARTAARLPLILPPEVEALESELVVAHDRRARIQSRVDALRADYDAALVARRRAAAAALEEEATDGATTEATAAKQRDAAAEVDRVADLIEAAAGALARADLEMRGPADRLRKALNTVLDRRLTEAEVLFDSQARALAQLYAEICSLRYALGRHVPRESKLVSVVTGEIILREIALSDEIEDVIGRATSLLRSARERSVAPAPMQVAA